VALTLSRRRAATGNITAAAVNERLASGVTSGGEALLLQLQPLTACCSDVQ